MLLRCRAWLLTGKGDPSVARCSGFQCSRGGSPNPLRLRAASSWAQSSGGCTHAPLGVTEH